MKKHEMIVQQSSVVLFVHSPRHIPRPALRIRCLGKHPDRRSKGLESERDKPRQKTRCAPFLIVVDTNDDQYTPWLIRAIWTGGSNYDVEKDDICFLPWARIYAANRTQDWWVWGPGTTDPC